MNLQFLCFSNNIHGAKQIKQGSFFNSSFCLHKSKTVYWINMEKRDFNIRKEAF